MDESGAGADETNGNIRQAVDAMFPGTSTNVSHTLIAVRRREL